MSRTQKRGIVYYPLSRLAENRPEVPAGTRQTVGDLVARRRDVMSHLVAEEVTGSSENAEAWTGKSPEARALLAG